MKNAVIAPLKIRSYTVFFSLFLAVFGSQSFAQSLPPQVLEEIQRRQQASGVQERVESPIDRARAGQTDEIGSDAEQTIDAFDTDEEEPSRLEADYQMRLGSETLTQYGYTLLTDRRVRQTAKSAGRIAGTTIVGVGDEFAVFLQGNETQDYLTKVDSEGRLILRGLPPVAAAGRLLSDIREDVEARVSSAFIGTDVFLSLAALSQVPVIVSGEVEAPGTYMLTSQDTALDALISARGVRKTGSLRRIAVLRSGKKITVDLYRLFRGQAANGVQLRAGDQVIVPPIGQTYAVAGNVMRPGIYELPNGTSQLSAKTAIEVAGGSIRPRGFELVLSRLNRSGDEVVSQISLGQSMIAGDGLVVVRTSARSSGKVEIRGHVAAPGMRALVSAPDVKALLQRSGGYLNDPYLPFAALRRENARTLSRIYKEIDLLDASSAGVAASLRDGDQLIILSRKDVAFLSSDVLRQVVLTRRYDGALTCRPLQNLARLTQDIQTERFTAVLLGAFVSDDSGSKRIADVAASGANETLQPVNAKASRVTDADFAALSKTEQNIFLSNNCPTIFRQHEGLLGFVLEHIAIASGSIRRPAVLPIAGDLRLDTLVSFVGGFSYEASLANVEVTQPRRTGGADVFSRKTYDLTKDALSDILVGPGSTVFFQSVPKEQEPGTVLLSGEFKRPGVYTIQRGERLSNLIKRAGGVTQRAYPFGAVFTRNSVKKSQEQALKRTLREMNTALTTAALKGNVDADALGAAQQLTASMDTLEVMGRVVVEADPRVLDVRKDLDVILEPGDRLSMPKRPNHVLAMGDVLNPGALQFVKGKTITQYLAETGGIQRSADEKRLFLVYPNGVARPLPKRFWGRTKETLPPGSTIVVPKDTDPFAALQLTREVTSIISQVALSAASFAIVLDRN